MEYWLIDAETGNGQGWYESLDAALQAAEIEAADRPAETLRLLVMRNHRREAQVGLEPELDRRAYVTVDLGLIAD